MNIEQIEEAVKVQMGYREKGPSCVSCVHYRDRSDEAGPRCGANLSVKFFTLESAWCRLYEVKSR